MTLSLGGNSGGGDGAGGGGGGGGGAVRKRPGLSILPPQLSLAHSVEVDTNIPLESQE